MNEPTSALKSAYLAALAQVDEWIHRADAELEPLLRDAIHDAQSKAANASEIGQDEINYAATFLARDLKHAAATLKAGGKEFLDWLTWDIEVAENDWVIQLGKAADPASVTWAQLDCQAALDARFNSGELAAPGDFECLDCGSCSRHDTLSILGPCPKCQAGTFRRL